MPTANIPFYRGQNVVFKFYQENVAVYIPAKVWNVEENATEIAEGVNGEKRDRLDKVTNYYSGTVDIYSIDQTVMQAIIDAQEVDDSETAPLRQTGAIQITHRDGTKAAYLMKGMKVGPWGFGMTGRADPNMLNVKFRFTEWTQVQTI
jgi:hypothetical protein